MAGNSMGYFVAKLLDWGIGRLKEWWVCRKHKAGMLGGMGIMAMALLAGDCDAQVSNVTYTLTNSVVVSNWVGQVKLAMELQQKDWIIQNGRAQRWTDTTPVDVDGWQVNYRVDEYLGPMGIGYVLMFTGQTNGVVFTRRYGYGRAGITDRDWLIKE